MFSLYRLSLFAFARCMYCSDSFASFLFIFFLNSFKKNLYSQSLNFCWKQQGQGYLFATLGLLLKAFSALRTPASSCTLRSEEHTSELQSRGHLVCRLLLDKKNKTHHMSHI